ncbi:unnamed protein product [marine sediment metagenome]|uniref:Uncharacterized protein n=1 Tax=marine sediment metagenome TaxID=412755 RepID=X0VB16_9ZZZZ
MFKCYTWTWFFLWLPVWIGCAFLGNWIGTTGNKLNNQDTAINKLQDTINTKNETISDKEAEINRLTSELVKANNNIVSLNSLVTRSCAFCGITMINAERSMILQMKHGGHKIDVCFSCFKQGEQGE